MPFYRVVYAACEYLSRTHLGNAVLPFCFGKHSFRLTSTRPRWFLPVHTHFSHNTSLQRPLSLYTPLLYIKLFSNHGFKMANPTQEEIRALRSKFFDRTTKPKSSLALMTESSDAKLANLTLANTSPVRGGKSLEVDQGMSDLTLLHLSGGLTSIRWLTVFFPCRLPCS